MSHDETTVNTLRELSAYIAQVNDTGHLRQLVIDIDTLLDLIEAQSAKIEGRPHPSAD
jgi:hypothetical protein